MVNINDKTGVIEQLRKMLTNHPEKKHYMLNVSVISSKDNSLIGRDEFEIYTNHPVHKITRKVTKLRKEGGICSLNIEELVEKAEGKYILILSV